MQLKVCMESLIVIVEEQVLAERHVIAPAGKRTVGYRHAEHVHHALEEVVLTESWYESRTAFKHHRTNHEIGLWREVTHHLVDPTLRCRHALCLGCEDDIVVGSLHSEKQGELAMAHVLDSVGEVGMEDILVTLFHDSEHVLCVVTRTVVDHNNLEVRIVIIEQRRKIAQQCLALILGIDYHRDTWLGIVGKISFPVLSLASRQYRTLYREQQD